MVLQCKQHYGKKLTFLLEQLRRNNKNQHYSSIINLYTAPKK